MGTYYEVTGSAITKYYYAGTSRVAMRTSSGVRYIFGDHLGSTSITADGSGSNSVRQVYKAWGEVRYSSGSLPTKYTFTGQYGYASSGEIGLLYYVARFYDPSLSRFISADTIVPDPDSALSWDRYLYARGNPLKYTDPSGHDICLDGEDFCYDQNKRIFKGDKKWLKEFSYSPIEREELIRKNLIETGDLLFRVIVEPYDWLRIGIDCMEGECSGWDLLGLLPLLPAGLTRYGDDVIELTGRTVGHHVIPRQILKILPEDIANAVRGVKGSPNIWQIPKKLHDILHSGPGRGGYYNAAWRNAVKPFLESGNITVKDILLIRDQLVNAFSLWKWRP